MIGGKLLSANLHGLLDYIGQCTYSDGTGSSFNPGDRREAWYCECLAMFGYVMVPPSMRENDTKLEWVCWTAFSQVSITDKGRQYLEKYPYDRITST